MERGPTNETFGFEDEKRPLLTQLSKWRVMDAGPSGNGTIIVTEMCDGYFAATLTSDEIRDLAKELMDLADEVENQPTESPA